MTTVVARDDKKLAVFLSYSRQDRAFVDTLVAALEARGLAPKIDTRDLPTLEDWRRELQSFIREADAVIFVVSPASVASPVCTWELAQAAELNKRLAPIVLHRVPDRSLPEVAARINLLSFERPEDFHAQADALAVALQTDLAWIKDHTRTASRPGSGRALARNTAIGWRKRSCCAAMSWPTPNTGCRAIRKLRRNLPSSIGNISNAAARLRRPGPSA